MAVRIRQNMVGNASNWLVEYDPNNPPAIFFDTNVWRSINDSDITILQCLQQTYGFRYRYSVTNFVELASHLEDPPSKSYRHPFRMFRACFVRMRALCDREILPSPEVLFLDRAGLIDYIDQIWIPDVEQVALAVELITNANSLAELTGAEDGDSRKTSMPRYVFNPSHYRGLRNVDGNSMRAVMEQLQEFRRPIASADLDRLHSWFMKLAEFFLLVRPSNGRVFYKHLTSEEQDQFGRALIGGAGQIFQTHCIHLVKKTVNEGRKIDHNDLYDMLQFFYCRMIIPFLLPARRRFFQYLIDPNRPHRVLSWTAFLRSATQSNV